MTLALISSASPSGIDDAKTLAAVVAFALLSWVALEYFRIGRTRR